MGKRKHKNKIKEEENEQRKKNIIVHHGALFK